MPSNFAKWAQRRNKPEKLAVDAAPDITAEGDDTEPAKSKRTGPRSTGAAAERDPETMQAIKDQLPTYATEADDLSEILGMVRRAAPDAGTVKPLVLDCCDTLGACIQLQLSSADLLLQRLTTDSHFSSDQVRQRATVRIVDRGASLAGSAVAFDSQLVGAMRSELDRGAALYRAGILGDADLKEKAQTAATAAVEALEALRVGNQRARVDATLPDGFNKMRDVDAQRLLSSERIRYQCSQQQPAILLSW